MTQNEKMTDTGEHKAALRRTSEQILAESFARLSQQIDILSEKVDSLSERFNLLTIDLKQLKNDLRHIEAELVEQKKINEHNTRELQHWKTARVILVWVSGVVGTLAGAGLIAFFTKVLK